MTRNGTANRDCPNRVSLRNRLLALKELREAGERVFVTIEPILRLDPVVFAVAVADVRPEFVNIGADSKRSGLDEPGPLAVGRLLECLESLGVEVRGKRNLERLLERPDLRGAVKGGE